MSVYRRKIAGLNSEQVMHAMGIDDAYHVERVLARGAGGVTERVTIEGAGSFIRKKIPLARANRVVWATLATTTCARLPQVAATYEMPDVFVAVYDDVPGETLQALVERAGALPASDAAQLACDLCEAVAALHASGIMHLDISPANIIVAADGAHLIDFGNAQMMAGTSAVEERSERPRGTWGFAAPEQFFSKADARSDIYALGRVLGYMLTGTCPDEENLAAYEAALADSARVAPALREVVERASAFEPGARYQRAEDMAVALDGASATAEGFVLVERSAAPRAASAKQAATDEARESGSMSPRPTPPGTSAPHKRGVPRWVFVVAAVVVVAAIGVVAWTMSHPQDVKFRGLSDETIPVASAGGAAASGSAGTGDASAAAEQAYGALSITESGWSIDSQGYVHYGVALANTSDAIIVDYPEVIITGRAQDGTVVFTGSQTMNTLFPGQTIEIGGLAGDGVAPNTVEFTVGRPADYAVRSAVGEPSQLEATAPAANVDDYGTTLFTGEVTVVSDGDEQTNSNQIWLTLILRDESGQIVFGSYTFVTRPAEGESAAYQFYEPDIPAYATAEVVALAW